MQSHQILTGLRFKVTAMRRRTRAKTDRQVDKTINYNSNNEILPRGEGMTVVDEYPLPLRWDVWALIVVYRQRPSA